MAKVVSRVEKVEFVGRGLSADKRFQVVTLFVGAQELDDRENALPGLIAGQELILKVDTVIVDEDGEVYHVS